MCSLTINTGSCGDWTSIIIEWTDHNNVTHRDCLDIKTMSHDKPRTIEISVNQKVVAELNSDDVRYARD